VNALRDGKDDVKNSACYALGEMGEKVATRGVFEVLLDVCYDNKSEVQNKVAECIGKMLKLSCSLSDLSYDTVGKLWKLIRKSEMWFLENVSPEKFIRAFLDTDISLWLPILKEISIRNGYGIILTENTVVVYGSKEPVDLSFSNRGLYQQLQEYFVNWLERYTVSKESA
jgi:hypothetical protein